MRVLIVCTYQQEKTYKMSPFVWEQSRALSDAGVIIDYFLIKGKGIKGYLAALPAFYKKIKTFDPDIIHAHYGLSGLFANLQRIVPVCTTFHGSDINLTNAYKYSKWAIRLSKHNIFVSKTLANLAGNPKDTSILACGIDLDDLCTLDKAKARDAFELHDNNKIVLFAGAFNCEVKNHPLAQQAINLLPNAKLIELKGYSRVEMMLLYRAADALIMTSHTEGSPQVIKEALLSDIPIVSVDVGDVKDQTADVYGTFICERSPEQLALALQQAFLCDRNKRIMTTLKKKFDNKQVAKQLISIYNKLL